MKNQLIADCISVFRQGYNLLQTVDSNDIYVNIGGHFRHCFDFVDCLILGIESSKIDYNKRERNVQIEADYKIALAKINETIEKLQTLSLLDFSQGVLVRHEMASDEFDEKSWCNSTLAREIEFLQSHTVHHYAIIGLKLANLGLKVDENFGVANSTLKYRTQNI
jgi:hypothetical protein